MGELGFIEEFPQGFCVAKDINLASLPENYHLVAQVAGYQVFQDSCVPCAVHRDGRWCIVVLGHIGLVGGDELADRLRQRAHDLTLVSLEEILYEAVGRWAIVACFDEELYVLSDCLGSRTVYFLAHPQIVASHVALVRRIGGRSGPVHRVEQSYALDLTEDPQVRALLPNFVLSLPRMAVRRFFPVGPNPNQGATPDQLLEKISNLWSAGMEWARGLDYRHAAAITAGFDSRLNLAMMPRARELTYFTYRQSSEVDESGFSVETWNRDDMLGRYITRLEGLQHLTLEFGAGSILTARDRQRLRANAPLDHDTEIVEEYWKAFGKMETVVHRSTAVEIGVDYYASDGFTGTKLDEALRVCRIEFAKCPDIEKRGETVEELVHRYAGPMKLGSASRLGYSPLSLYYWEIRQGRFQAEAQLGMDAAIIPLNGFASRSLWDAVLALPQRLRRARWQHRRLIARRMPELNGLPVNGDELETAGAEAAHARGLGRTSVDLLPQVELRYVDARGKVSELDSSREWILYVPQAALKSGCWAEASLTCEVAQASMTIDFLNPYSLGRETGCLQIELWVNDDLFASEDVGFTGQAIRATVSGVQRGDRVALRILVKRDLPLSWLGASRTELLQWAQSSEKASYVRGVHVGWSSPWVRLTGGSNG